MEAEAIQEMIDRTQYWDARILGFEAKFFGDEVSISIHDDGDAAWRISFLSCYKVEYETDAVWRTIAHVQDMTKPQLGYYGQDITLRESVEHEGFYEANIDLTILTAKVICKEVKVEKIAPGR